MDKSPDHALADSYILTYLEIDGMPYPGYT
jgi:hypothetical protein